MHTSDIFQPADPPPGQHAHAIAIGASWWTWSDEFRRFLREWAVYARTAPPPRLKLIGRLRPYGETYWHRLRPQRDVALSRQLTGFGRAFVGRGAAGTLLFFDRLLDRTCGRRAIRLLLATLRETIVELHCDPRSALYNPLSSVGPREGAFLLHADLYPPRYLFNIFDDVPADGSGASVFLPADRLEVVLRGLTSMPARARQRILGCLTSVATHDRYDELYDLLYGFERPWRNELKTRLRQARYVMPFRRGQGYLLDDRRWLHGRDVPTGGVTRNRIHRLIFDSNSSGSMRARARLKSSGAMPSPMRR
jgi:hypothetical protein